MSTDYKLRIYNTSGVLQAELVDFAELAYTKRVNGAGSYAVRLRGDHSAIQDLTHRAQVEIWRRDRTNEIDWYCDFYGLHLDEGYDYQQREVYTTRGAGWLWLLGTRYILYPAATASRSQFSSTVAETVLKTLVDYNAAANATTGNGRDRNGAITGLTVQADGSGGNSIDWTGPRKNLLAELQKIALVAGGDFDLVKTAAAAWEFRWYSGQIGTDRSSTVTFSLNHGNMAHPQYRYNRRDEKTVALVAGQGTESARETVTRTGTDYSASNDVEWFVDARNYASGALNAKGDEALDRKQARKVLTFDALRTPSCVYGSHYFLGDLVAARYRSTFTQKIIGVTVSVKPSGESISIETETQ